MKKLLLLLLLTNIYQSIFSQINLNDSTVQVISYYLNGDSYKYNYQITEFSIADGDTTLLRKYDSYYTISVVDSTEHSYLIEASCLSDSIMDTDSTRFLMMQEMSKLTEGLKYRYTIDEYGRFLGVENWEEIRDIALKGLDVAIDGVYLKNPEIEKVFPREQFLQTLKKQFDTKESIETYLLDEFRMLYMHHGNKYSLNEVYEDTLYLNNIFNNEVMTTPGQLWVNDMNIENGTVDIIRKAMLSADELAESAIDYFRKLLTDKVEASQISRSDLPFMLIDESYFHRINADYGWPIYVEHWRESTVGHKGSIRIVKIKLYFD